MYKKERPKLSVTALLFGNHNNPANWITSPGTGHYASSIGPTSLSNDGTTVVTSSQSQPQFTGSHNNSFITPQSGHYPPNHPLSGSKHLCAICGDRASGKHYGVYRNIFCYDYNCLSATAPLWYLYKEAVAERCLSHNCKYFCSCEGCKGFFKRTVRKDLTYACREERTCTIDKRQRNRCQYCRYQKCLMMGMKREAVQEERQRTKDRNENEVESTSSFQSDMPIERILEAELYIEPKRDDSDSDHKDPVANICQAADHQLYQLVEWAKHVPHFTDLPLDDQMVLLKAGWNELLIAAFSHRSMDVKDGIVLASGLVVHRNSAHGAGVGTIFDRVLTELVAKMREMNMDKTELGCLRAIVLFNPEAKGLKSVNHVENLRERVYSALEDYCRQNYFEQPGRFAKLLLRLPALRSIGLKCLEHLFFFKLIGDTPIDNFLMSMLEASDG